MNDPQLFVLGPKRRGRPRADQVVTLSGRVPPADRATLAALATARGTSLHRLTGDILRQVAQRTAKRR